MNWVYGTTSSRNRDTCDPRLIQVMDRGLAISPVDISIVWGWRGESIQNNLFRMKTSKKEWPNSEHNFIQDNKPRSKAFDFGPYIAGVGIPWKDTHLFGVVAGVFFAAANELGFILRWGGDWDMDGLTIDQTFMDWGHLEIEENEQ